MSSSRVWRYLIGWPLYGVVYFVTKNYLHYKQNLFVVKFWRNIISPRYLNFRHILQFTVTYAVVFFLTFSKDYQVFHIVFKLREKIKHSNSRVHSLLLLSRNGASSFRVRGLGLRALLQLLGLHRSPCCTRCPCCCDVCCLRVAGQTATGVGRLVSASAVAL
jgi:hypothetical protein